MNSIKIIEVTPNNILDMGVLCGNELRFSQGKMKKAQWFRDRYEEGLRIKISQDENDVKTGMIEFVPGEYTWRTLNAKNYTVIHCLQVLRNQTRSGYGTALLNFCAGNPLFIIDDEADAASLNTMVNRKKQSTINKSLDEIKRTTSSSIYMQVTGTPQAILLQTIQSGWKPYFTYYFEPGQGYLGGNFFFRNEQPPYVVFTDNDEADELLVDDEFPENGLKTALMMHLITSAPFFWKEEKFLIFLFIQVSVLISIANLQKKSVTTLTKFL